MEQIINNVNYWQQYRDPNHDPDNPRVWDAERVQLYYRSFLYNQPPPEELQGADAQYRALGPGQPLERPPVRDEDPGHRAFLDRVMPQLEDDPAQARYWRGTKFLGEGGVGMVGLWEYTRDPDAPVPAIGLQVAVKEVKEGQGNHRFTLAPEAENLQNLSPAGSPHIVGLVRDPGPISAADEDLGEEWDGVVRRLFLEYCALGSLDDLITRRIRLGVPLNELTLWRMFDCLIDGICALEYGYELQYNLATNSYVALPLPEFVPIVHFDIKPQNVLLADKRTIHPVHPICKISDLGSGRQMHQPRLETPQWLNYYERLRKVGTLGYLAPEQFTERWDYTNWQQSQVAGVYGAATNVWGIGCIMYQLAIMTTDPPNHTDPFIPQFEINNAPAQGVTYGVDLHVYPYSDSLLDLIQECLYEMPAHRPGLIDLKQRVQAGMEAAILADPTPEPWVDFLPAEPLPPDVANPPALPQAGPGATRAQKQARRKAQREARRRARKDAAKQAKTEAQRVVRFSQRCRYIDPETKRQCKNKFRTDGTQIYCQDHGD